MVVVLASRSDRNVEMGGSETITTTTLSLSRLSQKRRGRKGTKRHALEGDRSDNPISGKTRCFFGGRKKMEGEISRWVKGRYCEAQGGTERWCFCMVWRMFC